MKGMVVAMVLVAFAGPALAQTQYDDHERARRLVKAGEIVPLSQILAIVEQNFQGKMLEVLLQNWDGRWVYDVRLLTPSGWIIDLFYDARTKELIDTAGLYGPSGKAMEPPVGTD